MNDYKSLKINDNESILVRDDSRGSDKRCVLYLNNMSSGVLHSVSTRLDVKYVKYVKYVDSLINILLDYSSKVRGGLVE